MGCEYRTKRSSSRASRIRPTQLRAASSRRSASSSFFSSVASRKTTTTPSMVASLCKGAEENATGKVVPSLRVNVASELRSVRPSDADL